MPKLDNRLKFQGQGNINRNEFWRRSESETVADCNARNHPHHYLTDPGLAAAVNTALLLEKPLLVTGRPGTGKTDLAERIAWEFGLDPVLRFEAQSVSEAADLFYRFDLVGRLAESRLLTDRRMAGLEDDLARLEYKTHALNFIEFGPLGKAILKASLAHREEIPARQAWLDNLRRRAFPQAMPNTPQRSVVLIDEIDKASRDFPNDLLNSIERMEFRIRELDNFLLRAPENFKPIVLSTGQKFNYLISKVVSYVPFAPNG